jgi:hypothetical protein
MRLASSAQRSCGATTFGPASSPWPRPAARSICLRCASCSYLVQHKIEAGADVRTALVQSGRTRLRSILMTATATILALIPWALSSMLCEGMVETSRRERERPVPRTQLGVNELPQQALPDAGGVTLHRR